MLFLQGHDVSEASWGWSGHGQATAGSYPVSVNTGPTTLATLALDMCLHWPYSLFKGQMHLKQTHRNVEKSCFLQPFQRVTTNVIVIEHKEMKRVVFVIVRSDDIPDQSHGKALAMCSKADTTDQAYHYQHTCHTTVTHVQHWTLDTCLSLLSWLYIFCCPMTDPPPPSPTHTFKHLLTLLIQPSILIFSI